MSATPHEIPTHLNVEDKAYFGLSVRQVLFLTVGASLAYGLWNQLPDLALPVRLGLSALVFLGLAVVALARPASRPLEEWLFVVVHYALSPKAAVWRLPEDLCGRVQGGRGWEELSPEPIWAGEACRDRLGREELWAERPRGEGPR